MRNHPNKKPEAKTTTGFLNPKLLTGHRATATL
jgi:hypothetical protein